METQASKVLDPNGRPVESSALTTQPVRIDAGRLDLLDPELPDEGMVRQLEQRALFREKIIQLALRQTSPSQYVIHRPEGDEKKESVYPMGAAADAMFTFLGLTWAVAVEVRDEHGNPSWRRGDKKWRSEVRPAGEKLKYVWVESGLWSRDSLIALAEGKRLIGVGYSKDQPTSEMNAFENLKSRAVRHVLGLAGKDRAWYKLQGLDLATARFAEFQDHKSATSADPQEATLPFGREKGVKVCAASDEGLNWILPKVRESIGDPSRASFKSRNEALAAAIEAELARRAAKPAAEVEQADELERMVIALREEAQAQQSDPVKLEAFIADLKTVEQAKGALDYYRRKRAEREKRPA